MIECVDMYNDYLKLIKYYITKTYSSVLHSHKVLMK